MTITADFSGGEKTVTTEPLYQWDTGQKLALSGLPQTASDIQVHFANAAMAQAIVKATELVDNLPTCDIPNEFLQFGSAAKARAWVFYKASNTEGYTVRAALIPITPRKRPNDYVSPTDPDSKGIVEQAIELLESYETDITGKEDVSNKKTTLTGNESSNDFYPTTKAVADALSGKAPAATAFTFDDTTTTVTFNENNPKIIYLNATVDDEKGIVLTSADNTVQYFFGVSKSVKVRNKNGASTYTPWELALEKVGNKKNIINSTNLSSTEFYPSIKAVVDYLTANYIGNGNNTVSWNNLAVAVQNLINGKENTSNKLTSQTGIDEDSTDTEYPTAKAVFDFGEDILTEVAGDLVLKENLSNKKNAIAGNETSEQYYPTTKAVADALSTKAPASTAYTFDSTTKNVTYNAADPKIIYLNAYVNGKNAFVLTTANNYYQIALCYDGTEYVRELTAGGAATYKPWVLVNNENTVNKTSAITASNKTSTDYYPSIKAVVDYLATNYEALSNKLTSEEGIDSNSTDTEYPTAKAVYDLGVEVLALVNDDISNVESRLVLKESASNKQSSITAVNKASTALYPSIKAVYDYGTTITNNIEDVKAYIGYTSGDILGLHADFENKVFTRLGAAVGLNAGSDFNAFPMYGQRRRVVVDSDGVIIDSYSPEDVGESDTDVDVMVYQPKFYYKVVPLKLEKQSSGLGYHIRKANYYISSTPHAGFKLHPLFYDANGNEVDYVLFSAYEASYMWRRQVSTNGTDFRYVDSIFHDGVNTDTTIETSAVLKSLPGVKPISGQYKAMNKVNLENCALRKSPNWHLDTIQSVAANQLLIAIEYGTFNTQAAIGLGIVNNSDSDSNNCSSLTGSTSAETFNTASGMASETIYDVAGTETPFNTNGKVAVSYRGMENPWGNIWKHVNGINIWGDGTMNGGQAYIADNFNFNESSHSGNYKPAGFTIANTNGYISAFGYGDEENDWLFMPSETTGNSSLPVGDNLWCTSNLNGYRTAYLGGDWNTSYYCGDFFWYCSGNVNGTSRNVGGRLLFVPTATV